VISRLYPLLVAYSCAQILVRVRSLIFEFSSTFTMYSRHNPNTMILLKYFIYYFHRILLDIKVLGKGVCSREIKIRKQSGDEDGVTTVEW